MRQRKNHLNALLACAGLLWLGASLPAAAESSATPLKMPGAEKFSTLTDAQKHCPSDTIVWGSFAKKTKSFHLSSSKYYGKTKHGAYACEKDATAAGYHASKR